MPTVSAAAAKGGTSGDGMQSYPLLSKDINRGKAKKSKKNHRKGTVVKPSYKGWEVYPQVIHPSKEVPIWPSRKMAKKSLAALDNRGLLADLENARLRENEQCPPNFTCTAINAWGDAAAAIDSRGTLYGVMFRENRVRKLHSFGSAGCSMTFSPTRRGELYVGLQDGRACVYDIVFEKLVATLRTHKHEVHSISVNDDWLMTGAVDGAALYETDAFIRKHSLAGGAGIVACHITPLYVYKDTAEGDPMVFRPRIMCAFRDGHIVIWDGKNFSRIGKLHVPLEEGEVMFSSLCTSPEGSYVIAGTTSNTLFLWRIEDQRLLRILDFTSASSKIVRVQILHLEPILEPSAITCAVLGDDGRILLIELSTDDGDDGMSPEQVCRAIGEVSVPRSAITNFHFGRHPVSQQPGAKKSQSLAMFSVECTSDGHLTVHDVKASLRIARKRREAYERQELATHERKQAGSQPGYSYRNSVNTTDYQDITSVPTTFPHEYTNTRDRESNRHLASEDQSASSNADVANSPESEYNIALEKARKQDTENNNVASSEVVNSAFPEGRTHVSDQAMTSQDERDFERAEWYEDGTPSDHKASGKSGIVDKGSSEDYLIFKLRVMLRVKGAFPLEQRNTAWSLLMKLPENRNAYEALKAKGKHPNVAKLMTGYSLKSSVLHQKLEIVISCLNWWLPGLSELTSLPTVVFPFLIQFKSDLQRTVEFMMSFFLNFGSHWLESVPLPPLPILSQVDALLEYHDQNLALHMGKLGLSAIDYGWPLLRSVFSEVLNRNEWGTLWDHLIAYAADPSLLLLACVGYLIYFRHNLMSIKPETNDDNVLQGDLTVEKAKVESFIRQQNPIQINLLIKKIFKLRNNTPRHILEAIPSAVASSSERATDWPGMGPEPIGYYFKTSFRYSTECCVTMTSKDSEDLNIGRSSDLFQHPEYGVGLPYPNPQLGGPLASLPAKGSSLSYSIPSRFGGEVSHMHPKVNDAYLNYQTAERNRIVEDEELLNQRKAVINELERQRQTSEHQRLLAEKENQLLSTAEQNRLRWNEKTEHVWNSAQRSSYDSLREARLKSIAQKNKDTSSFVEAQRERKWKNEELNQQTSEQMHTKSREMSSAQKEREALENLDSEADLRRLRALRESHKERMTSNEQRISEDRQKAAELETSLIGEVWRTEDEERRLKRRLRREAVTKETEEEERRRQQRDKQTKELVDQLEREATLSQAARERRLRHAAEEEQDRLDCRREWVERREQSLQDAEAAGMRRMLEAEKEARRTAAAQIEKVQGDKDRENWDAFEEHRDRMRDIETHESIAAFGEATNVAGATDALRAQQETQKLSHDNEDGAKQRHADVTTERNTAVDVANRRRWATAKSRLRSGLDQSEEEPAAPPKQTTVGSTVHATVAERPRRPAPPVPGSELKKNKPLQSGPGGLGIGRVEGGRKVESTAASEWSTVRHESRPVDKKENSYSDINADDSSDFLEQESSEFSSSGTFSSESQPEHRTLADLEVRVGPAHRVTHGQRGNEFRSHISRTYSRTTTSGTNVEAKSSEAIISRTSQNNFVSSNAQLDSRSLSTESTISDDSDIQEYKGTQTPRLASATGQQAGISRISTPSFSDSEDSYPQT